MACTLIRHLATLTLTCVAIVHTSMAIGDSIRARCGYSPSAALEPKQWETCTFSQRQGYITIYRGQQTLHDFAPDEKAGPGTYLDEQGARVYRKQGLGNRGQLFQLPDDYMYVIWDPIPNRFECSKQALQMPGECQLGDGRVGFTLMATEGSSLNTLTLTAIGLERSEAVYEAELDGSAYMAELADLNGDGWPEVYVYVSSAGSGSYGSLVAYAVNNGKSATPIYLPPFDQGDRLAEGYRGHDEFRIVENRLVRRFPLYLVGDVNASPSGGTRQIPYKLTQGEAGWLLEVDDLGLQ